MQVDELLKPFPIKEFHPFPGRCWVRVLTR